MLSDTRELIQMMRARFGMQKVYLMGLSWGSLLGALTARDHPELLHGFAQEAGPLTEYTAANEANEDAWREFYAFSPLLSDQTWLRTLNMLDLVPRLEVPVYFLAGRYDYKAPSFLVEEYLNALDAPAGKRMFWFEDSAHVPFIEERPAFHAVMIDTILAESGG